MHFHVDALSLRSLVTIFIVSIVWHSGDRLVALFGPHHASAPPQQTVASETPHPVAIAEASAPVPQPVAAPPSRGPSERTRRIGLIFARVDPYPLSLSKKAAVPPPEFEDRWYAPSESKRAPTPFEQRGMFNTKI
jgi:hypothetical protein